MKPDFDRAARMAYKTLLALHIESLPVDPLQILSFCKNARVRTYDELMVRMGLYDYYDFKHYFLEGKEALTIRKQMPNGKYCYEVFYYNHGNSLRRRFTLGHELGHVILKHSMEEAHEEKEADYFASQLLMPHPVLLLCQDSGVSIDDIPFVSKLFRVSKEAARVSASNQVHRLDDDLYRLVQRQFAEFVSVVVN